MGPNKGVGQWGVGQSMWCVCSTSRSCVLENNLFNLFFVLVCVTFVYSNLSVFRFSYIYYNFPYMLLLCLNCIFLFKMFVVLIFQLNQFI
jgi:hypothetical protein